MSAAQGLSASGGSLHLHLQTAVGEWSYTWNRPTRRSGWTLFRHEPLAMRADDAKRHLAVVVGDLLGTPLALVAVPTGDVDA
jgi:hypothetical protein